jgi:uncharacterized protein YndB with AHSA1/START domain
MSDPKTETISVDQFVKAPPDKVWRALTDPRLHARWWVPGDISGEVGHSFHLEMPGWGSIPCEVIESEPSQRLVYTFNGDWTLTWTLVAEGDGTRLLLEHSGFDMDIESHRIAFSNMSRGWASAILPRLADLAPDLVRA